MSEFISNIWTAAGEWLKNNGIAFSALVAAGGYLWKLCTEQKRTARVALFHLLELRHIARSHKKAGKDFSEEYNNALCKAYGFDSEVEQPLPLQTVLSDHFDTLLKAKQTITSEFTDSYFQSLHELAKDSPVLAYRIMGNDKLSNYVRNADGFFEKYAQAANAEPGIAPFQDLLEGLIADVRSLAVDEVVALIDKDILRVARKCGTGTYLRTKAQLKWEVLPTVTEADLKKLTPIFNKFIERLAQRAEEMATKNADERPDVDGERD